MLSSLLNYTLLPEFFLSLSCLYLLLHYSILLSSNNKKNCTKSLINLAILILVFTFFLIQNTLESLNINNIYFYGFVIDYTSQFSKLIVIGLTIFCLLLYINYFSIQKLYQFEYILILLISLVGITLLCSANDLFVAYLCIELQSLSFYVLTTLKKNSIFSVNAGLKYFILGAIASSLFLFGSSLLYGSLGNLNLEYIKFFIQVYGISKFENIIFLLKYLKLSSVNCFFENNLYYQNFQIDNYIFNYFLTYFLYYFSYILHYNDLCTYSLKCYLMFKEELSYNIFYNFIDITNIKVLVLGYKINNFFLNETNIYCEDLIYSKVNFYLDSLIYNFSLFKFNFNSIFMDYLEFFNIFINSFISLNFYSNIINFFCICLEPFIIEFIKEYVINALFLNLEKEYNELLNYDYIINIIYHPIIVEIAIILIILSLFFKIASVPFNFWLPDIYEGSSSSITAFFSIVPKFSILIFFIRFLFCGLLDIFEFLSYLILFSGSFSIVYGSINGIEERKFKSLLAYSSVSNMGYILFILSSNTKFSIQFSMCYIFIYMIAILCIWTLLFIFNSKKLIKINKYNKDLSNFSNFFKNNKIGALLFSFLLFSISGLPPFIGFLVKFSIFSVAIDSSLYFIALFNILTSVIATFYYLRLIKIMFFENPELKILHKQNNSFLYSLFIVFFLLLLILFLKPNLLYLTTLYIFSYYSKMLSFYFIKKFYFLSDSPVEWQIGFQESAVPTMEGIVNFHNHVMIIISFIIIFVGWLLFNIVLYYNDYYIKKSTKFIHSKELEIIWTSVPALILIFLATPSFALLYSMDELVDPVINFKVIGHQWYWSYELSDYTMCGNNNNNNLKYDSYMLILDSLPENSKGYFRLLETNHRVLLPVKTHLRVFVSAADVLHSWAVPSFGLKVDACPGRLNLVNLFIKRIGLFFGQCSEICGVNHGFMPISIMVVDISQYHAYIISKINL